MSLGHLDENSGSAPEAELLIASETPAARYVWVDHGLSVTTGPGQVHLGCSRTLQEK